LEQKELKRVAFALNSVLPESISVLSCEELGAKEQGTNDFLIESEPNVDIRKMLFRLLSDRGWILMGLKSMDMSLEDVFVSLITNEGGVEG
jgi:ABC-2 type transport system ATP-binding protein